MIFKYGTMTETCCSGPMQLLLVKWHRAALTAGRAARPAALACALVLTSSVVARAGLDDIFSIGGEDTSSTETALRELLSSNSPLPSHKQTQLLAFYAARDFKPVWTGSNGAWTRSEAVRAALEHADEQGLRSEDYISALSQWSDAPQAGQDAAEYDLAMTAALLRYAKDVRNGRFDPASVYKDVRLPSHDFDAAAALSDALKHRKIDAFLADLPPPRADYRMLVAALARYRAIDAEGGWPAVPGKTAIALDGTDGRTSVLMKRLAFEDPVLAENPKVSMADLREAVLRYQRRNGLNDDGKVGPEMLKMLNIPASYRVQEIEANMERWRWMPRTLESSYVAVNIPDQSLDFMRDGSAVLHSTVVIGTKNDPTPILRTMVIAVVANPPWDIPDDIVAKSILPQLRRSPDYLTSRDMILADAPADDPQGANVNWHKVTAKDIPYQFQQNPGPDNALGSLMLDMPNDFNVYLHDTPHKELFASSVREKSHGCVRVKEISALATLALTGEEDNSEELDQAIASGETQRLPLPDPLAAYMVYWTASAKPDGTVEFRPDRYGRDRRLIAKMAIPVEQRRVAHTDQVRDTKG